VLRRFLLTSALMLVGTVGFASSAKAVDQPVMFKGTVSATCNLTLPTKGNFTGGLVLNATKDKLSTTGGMSASVGVDCTDGILKVSQPTLTAYPTGFTGTPANTATVLTKSGQSVDNTNAGYKLVAGDVGDATVMMDSTLTGSTFPAGNYEYTVTVTATL
jgi:hypothetical protein